MDIKYLYTNLILIISSAGLDSPVQIKWILIM